MQDLQTFIDLLSKGRKIHISILDLDGLLNTRITTVAVCNTIHSKPFCDAAKSTERGFRRCLGCKGRANRKAVESKTCFSGHCPWGIYEAAIPVVLQGTVSAIVYVGNYIIDEEKSRELISRSARLTGVDETKVLSHLSECEYLSDTEEAFKIGELVRDYILALVKNNAADNSSLHWLTLKMKRHAEAFYTSDISLKDLARIYHKNEKYMGRIFKSELGMSFGEYCISLRLDRAKDMLLNTNEKIIDVALALGFNNVPYFNRVFKKQYGVTPSEFKRREGKARLLNS
jgi:AraC-like DNA-binding protein